MTAFEMADRLQQYCGSIYFGNIKMDDVATMLRLQAHEIEALLEQINELQNKEANK